MFLKILSEERKIGLCKICKDEVHGLAFVRSDNKTYFYACYDCLNIGSSIRLPVVYPVDNLDETKEARVELLDILLAIAEEDEFVFNDRRLSVVKDFKFEIESGVMSSRLENYIKFNGNNIGEVLNLRSYALEAEILKSSNEKYVELVDLYKKSRIRLWDDSDKNSIRLLLSDKDIQLLDSNSFGLWNNLNDIKSEFLKDYTKKKFDNLKEIESIFNFYETKGYLTASQYSRLSSFYSEMKRRNRNGC